MKTLWQKLQHLEGMIDTVDMTEWQSNFVRRCVGLCPRGDTTKLSEKQVETIEELHERHFGS